MTKRKRYPKGQHPYGSSYNRERKRILAGNPLCWWCKVAPATTADHEPPLADSPGPHNRLVPACATCNYGRRLKAKPIEPTSAPPSRDW